jgi:hypothetical protein
MISLSCVYGGMYRYSVFLWCFIYPTCCLGWQVYQLEPGLSRRIFWDAQMQNHPSPSNPSTSCRPGFDSSCTAQSPILQTASRIIQELPDASRIIVRLRETLWKQNAVKGCKGQSWEHRRTGVLRKRMERMPCRKFYQGMTKPNMWRCSLLGCSLGVLCRSAALLTCSLLCH